MGLFTTTINGQRVNLGTLKEMYLRLLISCEDAKFKLKGKDNVWSDRLAKAEQRENDLKVRVLTLREEIKRLEGELDARTKQVDDLEGQLEVIRKALDNTKAERDALQEKLAKRIPKRGKGGRFEKKN